MARRPARAADAHEEVTEAVVKPLDVSEQAHAAHSAQFLITRLTRIDGVLGSVRAQADLICIKDDVLMDSLHGDPRYKALLRRMNLPE